jgi:hypothetical protein
MARHRGKAVARALATPGVGIVRMLTICRGPAVAATALVVDEGPAGVIAERDVHRGPLCVVPIVHGDDELATLVPSM